MRYFLCLRTLDIDFFSFQVIYLRRLKSLRALSLDGNPFCSKDLDYQNFILTFLPNLRYYEYNLINQGDRIPQPKYRLVDFDNTLFLQPSDNVLYSRQLITKVEEDEMELNKKLREEEEKHNRIIRLKYAFVDTMEPVIILETLEGSSWRLIMQIGGEVLYNFQKEYVLYAHILFGAQKSTTPE